MKLKGFLSDKKPGFLIILEFTVWLFPETLPQKFAIKLQLQTFAISPVRLGQKNKEFRSLQKTQPPEF